MHPITKPDIVGARITEVHSTSEDYHGCDCTTVYFTVDRGFSFTLPVPGYPWERTAIPIDADRWPDEEVSHSYKIEGSWPSMRFIPESSTTIDTVKRLKARTIQGVYCPKMKESLGFYEPDSAMLVFDDGSYACCVTVAPHGLGATGLHYRDAYKLVDRTDLVDFFEVPVEQEASHQENAPNPPEFERQYAYQPKWTVILSCAVMFSACAWVLGGMAYGSERGLDDFGLFEIAPSVASVFLWILTALSIGFVVVCGIRALVRLTLRQRIAFNRRYLVIPRSRWSNAETIVRFHEVIELSHSEIYGQRFLNIVYAGGKFTLTASMLPKKEDYEELCAAIARRATNCPSRAR